MLVPAPGEEADVELDDVEACCDDEPGSELKSALGPFGGALPDIKAADARQPGYPKLYRLMFHQLLMRTRVAPTTTDATLCSTFLPKALLQKHVITNGLVTSTEFHSAWLLPAQRYALCFVVRLTYRCLAYNLAAIFATDLNRKLI